MWLSAFIAGILTFLAPCTLPLVPGYIAFISNISLKEVGQASPTVLVRKKILFHAACYVLGFSLVFMLFGAIVGFIGHSIGSYRIYLTKIGAILVIWFGLHMSGIIPISSYSFLQKTVKWSLPKWMKPGSYKNSCLFGASFAVGWTPCIGPILGSILLLATTNGSYIHGMLLLSIFSLGLGIPFIILALMIGHAVSVVQAITPYMNIISVVSGVLLIGIGILFLTNNLGLWTAIIYQVIPFEKYIAPFL